MYTMTVCYTNKIFNGAPVPLPVEGSHGGDCFFYSLDANLGDCHKKLGEMCNMPEITIRSVAITRKAE